MNIIKYPTLHKNLNILGIVELVFVFSVHGIFAAGQ
jgi:hypothetical protein